MATNDKAKANKTSFKKGQSGNPGGQSPRVGPNGETITELCRAMTEPLITRAFGIAISSMTEPKDALHAIFGLLDRGWGKPKESMALDAKVEGNALPIIQILRYEDKPEGN